MQPSSMCTIPQVKLVEGFVVLLKRIVFFVAAVLSLAIPGWSTAVAQTPGTEAERVTRASALDAGYGAVVISIRSELYLDEPLDVYFLRVGGDRQTMLMSFGSGASRASLPLVTRL